MLKNLKIQNFKSIKDLSLEFGRVNIFIGEPNTGKSNILESIGILSFNYTRNLIDFVRLENMSNFFYDNRQEHEVKIIYDINGVHSFILKFINGKYYGTSQGFLDSAFFHFEYDYKRDGTLEWDNNLNSPIKFYKFKVLNNYQNQDSRFLMPPCGENLLQVLITYDSLSNEVSDIFNNYGYKILLRESENKIDILKDDRNKLISLPYSLVADTLQRMVFYLAAIETNKDSVLIFEEPESFAFPFYTVQLAEKIGRFNTNQFFISTHNPYFLTSIVEKTPIDDIRVFITSFSDYQTKVKTLSKEELTEVIDLGASVFFNLDKFIESE